MALPRTGRPDGVEILPVPWSDVDAVQLRTEQQDELAAMYDGEPDLEADLPPQEMLATVLVRVHGQVAGCGSLRSASAYGPGVGELKRMFIRPGFRGRGLARRVLARLEQDAVGHGLARLILETGVRQVQALALYRSAGYRRITNYGPYTAETRSVCYARRLDGAGTRVLVLNGTMGAGKTAIASNVADLLRERQTPNAWVDVDALCQVWPTPPDDPYAQGLALESLAAVARSFAARGFRHVILARVVEDPADRERYEAVFDGADVTIVRLTASPATRLARLTEREPEGHWRGFAFARTRELDAILTDLAVDDVVVDNDARPPREVAAEVLAAVGW